MSLLDLRTAFTQLKQAAGNTRTASKLKPYHFWYGPGPTPNPVLLVDAKSKIADASVPKINGKLPPAQESCRGRICLFDADDGLELHVALSAKQKPSKLKTDLQTIARNHGATVKRVMILDKIVNDEVPLQESLANRKQIADAVREMVTRTPRIKDAIERLLNDALADDNVTADMVKEVTDTAKALELRLLAFEKEVGQAAARARERNPEGDSGEQKIAEWSASAIDNAMRGFEALGRQSLEMLNAFAQTSSQPHESVSSNYEVELLAAAKAARKDMETLLQNGSVDPTYKDEISKRIVELVQSGRDQYARGTELGRKAAQSALLELQALGQQGNLQRETENVNALRKMGRRTDQAEKERLVTATSANNELTDRQARLTKATQKQLAVQTRVNQLEQNDGGLAQAYSEGKELGKGSFGKVVALDPKSNSDAPPLVIKLMTTKTESARREMDLEAQMAAAIGPHPNIAQVYGIAHIGQQEGLVLEKIEGGTMQQFNTKLEEARKTGAISEGEYWGAIQFNMAKTLEALAYMESQGYVHGDLKPANIMIDSATGEPKVIDLGSVRKQHSPMGPTTPAFQPPDSHSDTTIHRDVFAVGAMTYERGEDQLFYKGKPGGSGPAPYIGYEKANQVPGSQGGNPTIPSDWRELKSPGIQVLDQAFDTELEHSDPTQPDKITGSHARPKPGVASAETAYVDFVNLLTHPDRNVRLTPQQALEHPFMKDRMLNDETARGLIKTIVSPNAPLAPPDRRALDKRVTDTINDAINLTTRLEGLALRIENAVTALKRDPNASQDPGIDDKTLQNSLKEGSDLLGKLGSLQREVAEADELLGQAASKDQNMKPSSPGKGHPLPTQREGIDAIRQSLNKSLARVVTAIKDRRILLRGQVNTQ